MGWELRSQRRPARIWADPILVSGASRRPRSAGRLDPFPHAGREHAQLIAVFGDGAPSDLDPALFQNIDDGLVRQRTLGVFVGDELLDLRLDPAGRNVLAGRRRESG